jgi:E3 ubiquitin-protein ligase listerin
MRCLSAQPDAVLQQIGAALRLASNDNVLNHRLPCRLVADDDGSPLPEAVQIVINHCCPLLASTRRRSVRLTVYHVLEKLIPTMAKPNYSCRIAASGDDDDEPARSPPRGLLAVVDSCCVVVEACLEPYSLGDSAVLDTGSAEYRAVTAYLLVWNLLLKLFETAAAEQRGEYVRYIRRTGLLDRLMANVFRLMPQSPLSSVGDASGSQPADSKVNVDRLDCV